MLETGHWTTQPTAGLVLVLSFVAMAVGVLTFVGRNGMEVGPAPAHERGAIMAAIVFTAIGLVLLDCAHRSPKGTLSDGSERRVSAPGLAAFSNILGRGVLRSQPPSFGPLSPG